MFLKNISTNLNHRISGHIKYDNAWWQPIEHFESNEMEEAKLYANELRQKGYEVKGFKMGEMFLEGEDNVIAVKLKDDIKDYDEFRVDVSFKQTLFKRKLGSRINWGFCSLITFGFAYYFSTIQGVDTMAILSHSLSPVGWVIGGAGMLFFCILGIDTPKLSDRNKIGKETTK